MFATATGEGHWESYSTTVTQENVQQHFLDAKQSMYLNAIHGIMKQQQPPLYVSMGITWLITLAGTKCTMSIRNFYENGSQVRRKGEIGLNQPLICIYLFPPPSPQFFIFAPFQLISKKKPYCKVEKILGSGFNCSSSPKLCLHIPA
jgi:hypothetical protein